MLDGMLLFPRRETNECWNLVQVNSARASVSVCGGRRQSIEDEESWLPLSFLDVLEAKVKKVS